MTASSPLRDGHGQAHVGVIATGGTIAEGSRGRLNADALLHAASQLETLPRITTTDFCNIGSWEMTPALQWSLSQEINQRFIEEPTLAGIVVTHGTDSLEETAFFVDLLVSDSRPVVFTGAMRPPTAKDHDGPQNLTDALRIAASSATRDLGTLVTLQGKIFTARDARKLHSSAMDAFCAPSNGPIGKIEDGRVHIAIRPRRRPCFSCKSVDTTVELIRLTCGSNEALIRAITASGAGGIVIEAFGKGNLPDALLPAVTDAIADGIRVVVVSRTGCGDISLSPTLESMGLISGRTLDGIKACTLLRVALGADPHSSRQTLQGLFERIVL
jgi:L-asparaginase